MEFIFSQRGRRLLLFNGFKYRADRETADGWKWRCTMKRCKAKIYFGKYRDPMPVIVKQDSFHNHQEPFISDKLERISDDKFNLTEIPSSNVINSAEKIRVEKKETFNQTKEISLQENKREGSFEDYGMPIYPARGRMDAPQQYCLRWKYHHSNLQAMFSQLLERECFCDVTLACEGKTLKAHKVMLSACSTFFDSIFSQYEESNPIVILKDVRFSDMKALVQFMYKGEINVDNSELTSLLKTAEELRIKGLAEVSWRSDKEMEAESGDEHEPPNKKIKTEFEYRNDETENLVIPDLSDLQEDMIEEEVEDGCELEGATPCGSIWDTKRNHNESPTRDTQSPLSNVPRIPSTSVMASMFGISPSVVSTSPSSTPSLLQISTSPSPMSMMTDEMAGIATFTDAQGQTNIDLSQYPDIMKMNDYLESGGRRPQFWEEPFTKRLMEAIKNKELEMKVAAELMGVSYGTLYGRYRDAYGCLKHPYRVKDFWSEQGPAEVLAKLQRKELTLFRAAEMLNVTVTTLANYLSTIRPAGSSENDNENENEDNDNEDNEDIENIEREDIMIEQEKENEVDEDMDRVDMGSDNDNIDNECETLVEEFQETNVDDLSSFIKKENINNINGN